MADNKSQLKRWEEAGLLDAETAARIRAYEEHKAAETSSAPQGLSPQRRVDLSAMRWLRTAALVLAAILLACGVALFFSAHWDELGTAARFALALAMVGVFHLAGGLARASQRTLSTTLHAVGTVLVGPAIALVGHIYSIEGHGPTEMLLWGLAAAAGWLLLRDEAQQTLTLLLIPAWMVTALSDAARNHIGQSIYIGRLLFTWAILYLTFFVGSRRRALGGVLFAASAIAVVVAIPIMLAGWVSFSANQQFIPFNVCVWAWAAIAAVPLIVAAFHGHKGLIPVAVSIAVVIALPWCIRTWSYTGPWSGAKYTHTAPNFAAHALVAIFAVFLCWWGVRLASHALVNLGIVGFAAVVVWFYFSDIFSKLGRSLGLIVLGILFLAGGWALEKTRRRILARMGAVEASTEEAQ